MKTFCSPILQLPTRKRNICQRWDIKLKSVIKSVTGLIFNPNDCLVPILQLHLMKSANHNTNNYNFVRDVERALRVGKVLCATHNLVLSLIGSNCWCKNIQ